MRILADAAPSPFGAGRGEIFGTIKVAALVVLFALMQSMRNNRQWGKVHRRPPRRPARSGRGRPKVNLSANRSTGSKPQGGSS